MPNPELNISPASPSERALGGLPPTLPVDRAIARMEHDANLYAAEPIPLAATAGIVSLESTRLAGNPFSLRKALAELGAAAAVATACNTAPAEPTPQPTPIVTESPFPSPTLPKPTETILVTPSPTPAPTPTESPTPTPTPSQSSEPTPSPTPTPEIPKTKSFTEIVEAIADFDAGGELESSSGDLKINYSRSLLDGAGIESVSVNPNVVQRAHQVMVKETYKAVGQRSGSIDFADRHGFIRVDLESVKTVIYSLSKEEFARAGEAIEANGVKALHNQSDTDNHWIVFENGTLYIMDLPGYGLASIPSNWDKLDVATRIVSEGPAIAMQNLKTAALKANSGEYTLTPADPMYIAFGLNEENDWGYTGASGALDIRI